MSAYLLSRPWNVKVSQTKSDAYNEANLQNNETIYMIPKGLKAPNEMDELIRDDTPI